MRASFEYLDTTGMGLCRERDKRSAAADPSVPGNRDVARHVASGYSRPGLAAWSIRRAAPLIVVWGVISAAVAATPVVDDARRGCAPGLVVWETLGDAEPGHEWTVRIFETQQDLAYLRQLTIRLGRENAPAQEARWFPDAGARLPESFFVVVREITGDELESCCAVLHEAGVGPLVERSKPRCQIVDGESLTTTVDWSFDGDDAGLRFDPSAHGTPPTCLPEALTPGVPPPPLDEQTAPRIIHATRKLIAGWVRDDTPLLTGLSAMPAARAALRRLNESGPQDVPSSLPSDFAMELAVAPRDLGQAMVAEQLRTGDGHDLEAALHWLRQTPTPSASTTLRARLRAAVEKDRERLVALALRALLSADPAAARAEAVDLLPSPGHARAALGVFVLSDDRVRKDLESLDPDNADALHEAAFRVLAIVREGTSP